MSRNPSATCFIGNIPYDVSEQMLTDLFAEVGPVKSLRMVTERDSGKSKGYAFCEFYDNVTAESAIRNLNGHELSGRNLRVDFADDGSASRGKDDRKPPGGTGGHRDGAIGPHGIGMAVASNAAGSLAAALGDYSGGNGSDPLTQTLAGMSKAQLYEIMSQMKGLVSQNRGQARQILLANPQLTKALFQVQIMLGMVVNPQEAVQQHQQSVPGPVPPQRPGGPMPPQGPNPNMPSGAMGPGPMGPGGPPPHTGYGPPPVGAPPRGLPPAGTMPAGPGPGHPGGPPPAAGYGGPPPGMMGGPPRGPPGGHSMGPLGQFGPQGVRPPSEQGGFSGGARPPGQHPPPQGGMPQHMRGPPGPGGMGQYQQGPGGPGGRPQQPAGGPGGQPPPPTQQLDAQSQQELLKQVMNLTPQQIDKLPEQHRRQVLQLQQQMRGP